MEQAVFGPRNKKNGGVSNSGLVSYSPWLNELNLVDGEGMGSQVRESKAQAPGAKMRVESAGTMTSWNMGWDGNSLICLSGRYTD